jgi:hypothetical protein
LEILKKDIVYDSTNATLIVIKDITSLVNAEYGRSIEKLSDIMIASASHDMRTPLNTTSNMLYLLDE